MFFLQIFETIKFQSELVALFPVKPLDIVAIEFLTKNEKTQKAGAAVVELSTFESLDKAAEIDGREMGGMVIWATKDKGMLSA